MFTYLLFRLRSKELRLKNKIEFQPHWTFFRMKIRRLLLRKGNKITEKILFKSYCENLLSEITVEINICLQVH